MTDRPTDQAARDRIRRDHDATLLVDAGAGTGKTTALVDRITAIVTSGVPVDAIAAITFTEAAATELRQRVRAALEAAATADPGDAHLREAVAGLDRAAFTTLHAFALRLLREHAVEAGLPPRVALLTTVEEEVELDRRWEGFLDGLFDDGSFQRLIGRLARLGISPTGLRDVAEKLHQDQDRIDELGTPPADLPEPDVSRIRRAADAVFEVRRRCIDPGDKLAQHLDGTLRPRLDAIAGMHGEQLLGELLSWTKRTTRPSKNSGGKAAWPGCKAEVHAALDDLDAALEAVRTEQEEVLARVLAAHLGRFVAAWAAERRRRGRLVFADLLVMARDLLRDRPDVRAAVRGRYRHVLVDEFQDTDPIQYDLALLIGCDPGQEPEAIDPGRLFVVGDPKQSIYSFRRADLGVYERAVRRGDDLEQVDLVENFRSRPEVVDWANAVFRELMVATPGSQPAYVPLVAHRTSAEAGPRVHWFGRAHEDTRAGEVRVAEADEAAQVVRHLIDEGTEADDIAVLVRRHGTVRLLERSLTDADVPYRIESRSLIHQTDEVRGLRSVLSVLADPEDEVALVATLRLAAVGCSDRDLVDHRAAGGRWSLWAETPEGLPPSHPAPRALEMLRALAEETRGQPLGRTVDLITDRLRLRELAFAHRRPRDRWRRLDFVADQARAFDDAGGHLRGFVRHLEREAEQGVRVDEHVVQDEDDASVRITTVHGAKGLEYPVVVLLGLDQALDRPPGHLRVAWHDDGRPPELALHRGLRTPGFDEANARFRRRYDDEETRLLYVATTRARERLVVSRHHRAGSDCHAARLERIAGELDGRWEELVPSAAGGPAASASVATANPAAAASAREQEERFVSARAAVLAAADRPSGVAVTRAAELVSLPSTPVAVAPGPTGGPTDEAEVRPESGRAVGRAVHAVLQDIPLDADPAGQDLVRRARRAVVAEGVPDAADDVARMVANCLRVDAVAAAAGASEVHREVHLGVPVPTEDGRIVAVEGVVDLLYRTAEGWVIVDHKTDQLGAEVARPLPTAPRAQVALYAAALRRILGDDARIARAVLVFARDGSQATVDGADLTRDADALLRRAAQIT